MTNKNNKSKLEYRLANASGQFLGRAVKEKTYADFLSKDYFRKDFIKDIEDYGGMLISAGSIAVGALIGATLLQFGIFNNCDKVKTNSDEKMKIQRDSQKYDSNKERVMYSKGIYKLYMEKK